MKDSINKKIDAVKKFILKHRFLPLAISAVLDVVILYCLDKSATYISEYIELSDQAKLLVSTIPTLTLLWFFRTHDTREAIQKTEENINSNTLAYSIKLITDSDSDKKRIGLSMLAKLKRDNIDNKHFSSIIDLTTVAVKNLSMVDLSNADLSKVNLSNTDLSKVNLSNTDLSEANLSEANLSEAILGGAVLFKANLSGADLRGAILSGADLRGADLRGADLSKADLYGANLRDIDNSKSTKFCNNKYNEDTVFPDGTNNPPSYFENPQKEEKKSLNH